MGLFKQLKDVTTMISATPGMVAQGRKLVDQGMQQYDQVSMQAQLAEAQAYHASLGQPIAGASLAPINGVDLATYAWVGKQVAKANYDQSLAPGFAAQRGISAADWEIAVNGWAARMQAEPVLGREFRRHYDAA